MNCTNGVCSCDLFFYYDFINLTCKPQTTINTTCSSNLSCLQDQGLFCMNNICDCPTNQKWSIERKKCITPLTYADKGCNYTSDCYSDYGLICNQGSQCNCPSNLVNGMCDCIHRNSTTEYFWNGTRCQEAYSYGSSCANSSTNYMCKYMKEATVCININGTNSCQCPSLMYFDYTVGYCKNQTLVNTACSVTPLACRSDLGLICQSNICVCNSTSQFWLNATSGCTNYYPYTDTRCTSNSQCASTLICNNSTNTKCTCPVPLSSNSCDCPRAYGNETYWNGQYCTSALLNGSACANASSTYMCAWITQGTVCNSSSGSFKCQCPSLMYFDYTVGYCKNQTLVNTACSVTPLACRSDLGLICQSNICVCNSTSQFWLNATSGCTNYYPYTDTRCTSNSQCASTLICNNSTNTKCTCPVALSSNSCDCPRAYGNETYWNSSSCVAAKSYNESCANGSGFADYICQTLTEATYCNNVTKRCDCGLYGGFNTITNKCAYCSTGSYFFKNMCFSYTSASSSYTSGCNGNASVSYATIVDSETLNFFNSILPSDTYWVGFKELTGSCTGGFNTYSHYDFGTSDGSFRLNSTFISWCSPGTPIGNKVSGRCPVNVYYDAYLDCFYNDYSTSTHRSICQSSAS